MSVEKPSSTKNTVFISANYNVRVGDDIINVDTTAGVVNLYLPNIKASQFNLYPTNYL